MVTSNNAKLIDPYKLELIRHSASHVMAEAVKTLFPGARFGIGPAIENGFYYDFELPRSLSPDDLPIIEAKMTEIIASNASFTREEVAKDRAQEIFANQPYKLELIDELPDDKVTLYRQGNFVDLRFQDFLTAASTRIPHIFWIGYTNPAARNRFYQRQYRSKSGLKEVTSLLYSNNL